jgi:hypothetical protein
MCAALIYDLPTTGLKFLLNKTTLMDLKNQNKDGKLYKLPKDDVIQYVYD